MVENLFFYYTKPLAVNRPFKHRKYLRRPCDRPAGNELNKAAYSCSIRHIFGLKGLIPF